MKSNFSKGMLMTALITGTVLCSSAAAFAEELQEYTLDQMVVTATERKSVMLRFLQQLTLSQNRKLKIAVM